MGKPVAVEGDVQATPGAVPYPPAVSGAWSPGNVEYQTHSNLESGGKAVIYEASCTFTFVGADPNGAPVNGDESVTLTAKSTTLMNGADNVLVTGDTEVGAYGNTLMVSASGPFTTA